MKTVKITQRELRGLLDEVSARGASIVTITSETTPRMRKTDNPYYDSETKEWSITKHSRVNGIINWIYENSVNRQREREGKEADFKSFPRQWGERIKGTPLVYHEGKDKYYLELKVENSYESEYIDDDGNKVDKEEIEDFLYTSSSSRQGVEDEIILRDYSLKNITSLKMRGILYEIKR